MVELTQVPASSHVKAVGYDAAARELHIHYLRGKPAVYKDVAPDVAALITSQPWSIGKALHQHIRGKHAHEYR